MEVDARFRRFISILPQGKKTQAVVKHLLEKDTAFSVFIRPDRSGIRKTKDIEHGMQCLYTGKEKSARMNTIVTLWKR